MKVNVAGVAIDNLRKSEVIEAIDRMVKTNTPGYLVTPYSEMIVFALKDPKYREVLNNAALAIPDGIGILWAAKYLSAPSVGFISSLLSVLFNPEYIRSVIPERITGSRLVYDIAKLAADNNYSISLIGGMGNTAAQSAYELKKLCPNLNVKLALSNREFDAQVAKEISETNSDILLIAYSPPQQETWLAENIKALNVKVAIGLGGTFDYLSGKHPVAPGIFHSLGLEWFWRLITQPRRIVRIWNAVPVFAWKIYKYKVSRKS
jgi:N-acetylglucosaminyldiphosphoundecaprenol N-acetyl-beta-D-mannosaminyltransferase